MSDSDVTALVLEPDNPCQTIIKNKDTRQVVYIVETQHTNKRTTTVVKNAKGETLAMSEWKDVKSDIITLGNGKPVPLGSWLKKSIIPFKDTVYMEDQTGKKFKWKGNGPGMSLELYSEDDKISPVARFSKPLLRFNRDVEPAVREYGPATLLLDSRGAMIQDLVVISFLFLEKSRRARENSTMNHADAVAVPMLSTGVGSSS